MHNCSKKLKKKKKKGKKKEKKDASSYNSFTLHVDQCVIVFYSELTSLSKQGIVGPIVWIYKQSRQDKIPNNIN